MKMINKAVLTVAAAGALALTAAPSMAQVSFGIQVGPRYHHYYRHHRYYRYGFGLGYAPGYYDYDYDYPYYDSNCWVWSSYWGRYVRSRWCD